MANRKSNGKVKSPREASTYRHPEADSPLRPDVGTQPQFKKRKPPVTYRYDSSLSPALEWDGQNHARETGEALIREILEAKSLENAKARGRTPQSDERAVPQLGGQGGAAVVRRADAAAVRPRAALDQGHHRDAQGPQARPAARVRTCSAIPAIRSPTRC